MPRLTVIQPGSASEGVEPIFSEIRDKFGNVFNIFKGMANSAAGLKAYLAMSTALSEGELDPVDREAIYLAVSERHRCQYCVSAHSVMAEHNGLSGDEIERVRQFASRDSRRRAMLQFVKRVMDTDGFVSEDELAEVKRAGVSDGQIVEAIAYIGLATFSNLFNHVHDTPLDFPAASKLS